MTLDLPRTAAPTEAALHAGDDPLHKARGLLPLHRNWAQDTRIPQGVRPVVARSWARAGTVAGEIAPVDASTVRERRRENGQLDRLLPLFKQSLLSLAAQAGNQLVVSDAQGYVLWVMGPSQIRRQSDGIGFVHGARWRETDVGTNGIGAAMAERAPVQIFGPEHAREEQHSWVCTSAPVIHPASGKLLGAITLAGSYRTAHPHTLSLVSSVAAMAGAALYQEHTRDMYRLEAATVLPEEDFLLVDSHGMVASSRGYTPGPRIALPAHMDPGNVWIPGLGPMRAEPVDGGWILQRSENEIQLELSSAPYPRAVIRHGQTCTEVPLGPRHWQIMQLFAAHPAGVDAATLRQLWPQGGSAVTIRAEISRLRGKLGGLIAARPYRLLVPAQHTG
ncbi:GAF domain-containing protein [Glutamicibacter sp. MNS18]|uniref:helix-turn-helix domain-containing protein n=1 Tax=Glutamicibacter sp. MNS18 TaxID=2989817 RepID=UPI002236522C|nr:helix-turn-helix domain-containing protein [Glutamicibacter sp. MNS18]MCW4465260.1 GAF domain-containing protein [Glutamicibacter sp. MNS18]